jgi:DNA polymerase II
MKGFIVYPTYSIIDGKPIIQLYGRLESGESFRCDIPNTPYFFIRASDAAKARKVISAGIEETSMRNFQDEPVVRVIAKEPGDVPILRRKLEEAGMTTYEADIRFVQRFLMDNEIMGAIEIESKAEKGVSGLVFHDARIKPAKPYEVELKVLALDIETDKEVKKIYSISLVCGTVKEVHIVTSHKVAHAVLYDDDELLLKGVIDRINELDPDIITGWSIVDFDLKVISERLSHYKIPFCIGRDGKECSVKIYHDFLRTSQAQCPGRIVFDGIALLRLSFISYPDYKLDTVAGKVLGEHKLELPSGFWDEFPTLVRDNPQLVVEYNLMDSMLVIGIIKKLRLIDLIVEKALLTGMQLDRVRGSVASLDSLYIRRARKRGYVCPNSSFAEREAAMKGAFVMQPKAGIYDNVGVFDYKSLYPSIMMTFNIDPLSHRKEGTVVAPNGARFVNEDGILPEIISELMKERDKAKKSKDTTKSHAIKITMNSFYGVLANPSCRFYNLEMGNAITSFARQIIQETATLIRKEGYDVLYGDTDSVFVDFQEKTIAAAEKKAKKIAGLVNDHYKELVKKEYHRESRLELQYEKMFSVLMLPKIRGSEEGAKKRYAGLLASGEMQATGLELVRRDWTDLAKEVQKELLDRVFHKKEVATYIKNVVEELRAGKRDASLIYRKGITKDLSLYTKTTPPHVKAARMLPKLTGNVIEYYMTVNGPEPVSMRTSALDYEHYIDKQIKPLSESILSLFGMSFDDVLKNSKQRNLFDY